MLPGGGVAGGGPLCHLSLPRSRGPVPHFGPDPPGPTGEDIGPLIGPMLPGGGVAGGVPLITWPLASGAGQLLHGVRSDAASAVNGPVPLLLGVLADGAVGLVGLNEEACVPSHAAERTAAAMTVVQTKYRFIGITLHVRPNEPRYRRWLASWTVYPSDWGVAATICPFVR